MDLLRATRPWHSSAGAGLLLRGRRADGAGPTIHFLPGVGFCGAVYWPFLQRFLPSRGLFLHDIEGHGHSEVPPHFSGVSALIERIPRVIAEQGFGSGLIGMGHSFGAALSLQLAARYPGLFRALVLLDPIVFPPALWLGARTLSALRLHPFARSARERRGAWPSRDAALAHLRGRGIYKGWTEDALACFVDHAMQPAGNQWVLRCPPAFEAQIYEQPIYAWRAFRRVRIPMLFLYGAGSYPFFGRSVQLARRANPAIEVRTLPGQHCFMLEDPAAAHQAVEEFLFRSAG